MLTIWIIFTAKTFLVTCHADVMAFQVSRMISWDPCPPCMCKLGNDDGTVLRKGLDMVMARLADTNVLIQLAFSCLHILYFVVHVISVQCSLQ